MTMMTKNILTCLVLTQTYVYGIPFADQDLDGVPDTIDKCPNTPFLNAVNKQGCTTTILLLPQETESKNIILTLDYSHSTNEDLLGHTRQNLSSIQLSYYDKNWQYALKTGYYNNKQAKGTIDTTFKVKRRFKLSPKIHVNVGAGVRLPSYHFSGNKTDYTLYTSLNYYHTRSLSLFMGLNYTFINDVPQETSLQNINAYYLGVGKFFTPHFYMNISYNYSQSKFTNEHSSHNVGTTLYYKINQQWFTTLSYNREFDDDLHDALHLQIGYKLW